jgi:hypothetical protein
MPAPATTAATTADEPLPEGLRHEEGGPVPCRLIPALAAAGPEDDRDRRHGEADVHGRRKRVDGAPGERLRLAAVVVGVEEGLQPAPDGKAEEA